MNRIEADTYFLEIASLVAKRSTCMRRSVGCILVDTQNHIVATGYNGVPTKFIHCLDSPCEGAFAPPGSDLDLCNALHAEVNAFLQLKSDDELTAYLTVAPCFSCAKMFANSKVKRIVSNEFYVHEKALDLLHQAGIRVDIPSIDPEFMGITA